MKPEHKRTELLLKKFIERYKVPAHYAGVIWEDGRTKVIGPFKDYYEAVEQTSQVGGNKPQKVVNILKSASHNELGDWITSCLPNIMEADSKKLIEYANKIGGELGGELSKMCLDILKKYGPRR